MEIEKFLEQLSSDRPTPGGGSASALAGAVSASLVAMVAGLSLRKKESGHKEMEEIRKKALDIRKRLFRAIAEDSKSFDAVMKAFRLPRNSERERRRRSQEIQNAYRKATLTPQLVCQHSLQLLEYSKTLIIKGNPNAISDAGVAAFLADTAVAGGLLNIEINLAAVTDKAFGVKIKNRMRNWILQRNRLMKTIRMKLNGVPGV